MNPVRIWLLSIRLDRAGWRRCARILKAVNAVVYSTALPPEAEICDDIRIWHNALGVVIHPDTRIGRKVQIAHHVTIGAGSPYSGTPYGVIVEDGVSIGTGAVIAPKPGHQLTLGTGAKIGANAVVTRDVPEGTTVVGGAIREIRAR